MLSRTREASAATRQSIWLLPTKSDSERLQRLVDLLASDIGSESFPPHLTLLSDVTAKPDLIWAVLTSLGRFPCIEATVAEPRSCDDPRRAVHLPLRVSGFGKLRSRVAAGIGRTDEATAEPHVSLVYGSHTASRRDKLLELVRQEHPPRTIAFDRVALVEHDDDKEGLKVTAMHQTAGAMTGDEPALATIIEALLGFKALAVSSECAVGFASCGLHEYLIDARQNDRRDRAPLDQPYECIFCAWYRHRGSHAALIPGTESRAQLADEELCGGRLLVYNGNPNPLPDRDAVRAAFELFETCRRSDVDLLAVCNLPGSGASVPDHFHWQVVPWTSLADRLLKNYRVAGTQCHRLSGVDLWECSGPVPAVEFSIPGDWSVNDRADWILAQFFASVLHRQQGLSANLYLFAEGRRGLIVWRDPSHECPCSDCPRWRWAWREMLGAICIRAGAEESDLRCGAWLHYAQRAGIPAERAKRLILEWQEGGATPPAAEQRTPGG